MSAFETDPRRLAVADHSVGSVAPRGVALSVLSPVSDTVAAQVLSRLHASASRRHPERSGALVSAENRILRLLTTGSTDGATRDIRRLLGSLPLGHSGRIVLMERLARRLGEAWCADSCDFMQVTIAMSRLQALFRLESETRRGPPAGSSGGRALLLVPPAERHVFALSILEETLGAAGWTVEVRQPVSARDFRSLLSSTGHDMTCLSWSTGELADLVMAAVSEARRFRRDASPIFVAGGQAAVLKKAELLSLGVDYVCNDAYSVLHLTRWKKSPLQREDPAAGPSRAGMLTMA